MEMKKLGVLIIELVCLCLTISVHHTASSSFSIPLLQNKLINTIAWQEIFKRAFS